MIDTNSIAAKFTKWRLFFKVAFILFLILLLMIPNLLDHQSKLSHIFLL